MLDHINIRSFLLTIRIYELKNSVSVAKTVAPDFESNCVSEEKAEFSLVAEEGFEPPTFGL